VSLRTGTPIAFREPVLRYAIGGYILNSFGMNGIAGFIQDYGVERGFALEEIGGYFLGILLLGSVGTVLGGSLSARWERRSSRPPLQLLFAFLGITGMLAIPWLFGAFLVQDRFQFITLCGVGVFFVFVGTGPLNALLVRGSPPGFVNFVQGLTIVLLNFFGSFAAPPIIGAIAQRYSLQAGLLVCVVALLISTVIWILGVRWGKRAA
jgi:dipeptide/tripeptide permease